MAGFGSLLGGLGAGGAIGAAIVKLQLDSTQYNAQLAGAQAKTTSSANAMGASTSKFAGLAQTAMLGAGAAVAGLAVVSVRAAADLGESLNKARVVFGDAASSVIAFSETSASSFGIAQSAALEAAAGFGAMTQSAGLSAQASADMGIALVKLAADMASLNNVDPSDMLERLRGGLAGEAEPLRKFGVFISEARVETEAYASGIADLGSELTDAQKIQARYNILLQDTAKAQGDFARTSDSLPNQLRILKAEFTDLAASVGEDLIPVAQKLVEALGLLVPLLSLVGDNLNLVLITLAGFAAVKFLPPLLFQMALGFEAIGAAKIASGLLNVAAALSTLGPAVAGLTVAFFAFKLASEQADATALHYGQTLDGVAGRYGTVIPVVDSATEAYRDNTVAIREGAAAAPSLEEAIADLEAAHDAAALAARNQTDALIAQHEAYLTLADPIFAVINALQADAEAEARLAAARRTLDRLTEQGAQGTRRYREAQDELAAASLEATQAHEGLAANVRALNQQVEDGNISMQDAKTKLREMGRAAGLSRPEIQGLVDELREGVREAGRFGEAGRAGGAAFVSGLISAINGMAAQAYQAAYELGAKAELGLRESLQTRSPSKVTRRIGVNFVEGLIEGLRSEDDALVKAATEAIEAMTKAVQRELDKLTQAFEKQISKLEGQLSRVQSQASSLRGAVTGGFSSFMDISGAFDPETLSAAGGIGGFFSGQVSGAQQFADVLNALKAQGASAELLSQIAAGGSQAVPFAQSLLQQGPGAIAGVNAAIQTIADLAGTTGKGISEAFFGERIDDLRDRLKDVHSEQREQTRMFELMLRLLDNPERLLRRLEEIRDVIGNITVEIDSQRLGDSMHSEFIRRGRRNGSLQLT